MADKVDYVALTGSTLLQAFATSGEPFLQTTWKPIENPDLVVTYLGSMRLIK
jgi:hypothetical protein